ncbi:MAG: hypothetical protein M3362_25560, partial [Acidobacteriota bacterium]|nr:hypothetical protein [Acidobacteriota bacterium]
MCTRLRILALILGVVMLSLMPLMVSAATRRGGVPAGHRLNAPVVTPTGGVSVPVTGTTSKGGKFTGTFNI